jgi:hypothetical protein
MWLYPGPTYPDCPYPEELSVAEVDSQAHKVWDLGVNPNPGAGHAPLQGGVANSMVSTLDPVSTAFTILSFNCNCDLAQGLGSGRGYPRDADPPEEVVRREAKRTSDEETRSQREREMPVCC